MNTIFMKRTWLLIKVKIIFGKISSVYTQPTRTQPAPTSMVYAMIDIANLFADRFAKTLNACDECAPSTSPDCSSGDMLQPSISPECVSEAFKHLKRN